MNRTTIAVLAIIAAAGLSTMVYAAPEQRGLALGGGYLANSADNGFFGDGFHKHIKQIINQVNRTPTAMSHPTALTLNLMFGSAGTTLPTVVNVSGTLTDTRTGLGVGGATITFTGNYTHYAPGGVSPVITNSAGTYRTNFLANPVFGPGVLATIQAHFAGAGMFGPSDSQVRTFVCPAGVPGGCHS
jgi:hypothetical protein